MQQLSIRPAAHRVACNHPTIVPGLSVAQGPHKPDYDMLRRVLPQPAQLEGFVRAMTNGKPLSASGAFRRGR